MLEHTLDAAHSILYVRPQSPLQRDDFVRLAATVDPYIEKTGDLAVFGFIYKHRHCAEYFG